MSAPSRSTDQRIQDDVRVVEQVDVIAEEKMKEELEGRAASATEATTKEPPAKDEPPKKPEPAAGAAKRKFVGDAHDEGEEGDEDKGERRRNNWKNFTKAPHYQRSVKKPKKSLE